jgi:hypothetical protein
MNEGLWYPKGYRYHSYKTLAVGHKRSQHGRKKFEVVINKELVGEWVTHYF